MKALPARMLPFPPIATSTVAIANGSFTSTPAVCFAQIADIPEVLREPAAPEALDIEMGIPGVIMLD